MSPAANSRRPKQDPALVKVRDKQQDHCLAATGCPGMTEGSVERGHPKTLIRIGEKDDLVLLELQFLPIQLPVYIATNLFYSKNDFVGSANVQQFWRLIHVSLHLLSPLEWYVGKSKPLPSQPDSRPCCGRARSQCSSSTICRNCGSLQFNDCVIRSKRSRSWVEST